VVRREQEQRRESLQAQPDPPAAGTSFVRGRGKGARAPDRGSSAQATLACLKKIQYTGEGDEAEACLCLPREKLAAVETRSTPCECLRGGM
jgi:hypothetical protein